MNVLHPDDRKGLVDYVNQINDQQEIINIIIRFPIVTNEQRFDFSVNGKHTLKDNIDEAICFLDGLRMFADAYILSLTE